MSDTISGLGTGDVVTLGDDGVNEEWDVRGVTADGRYAICTRAFNEGDRAWLAEREADGHVRGRDYSSGSVSEDSPVVYTIIDFERGVNGLDNYYGLGYETDEQVAAALKMFEAGDAEVSHRRANYGHLDVRTVRRATPSASSGADGEAGQVVDSGQAGATGPGEERRSE